MATVYSALSTVPTPKFPQPYNHEEYQKNEEQYVIDLKKELKSMGYKGKNFGEILRFQVADGYAQYMVVSMRPLKLMHLPLCDAYSFEYAHLLTSKEVNEQIKRQKALLELFG
tara:strand:+ start:105 stop:443 length:339 start_codon:yes stop_codon:yes gene_type:complete